MRIVQVSPFFHPHAGGVESHVRTVGQELVRQGHEVVVLTSRHDPALPAEERMDGLRVVRARTWATLFNTPVDPSLGRLVRESNADVVHLHYPPPLPAYFAVRGLGGRRVPTCLTYHCDLYLAGAAGGLLTELYRRVFLPPTMAHVDRVIVHTRSYGTTSRSLRGRSLAVIPSTVDVMRFRPDVDGSAIRRRLGLDGYRVLAFTGRLVPHKGVDEIVRVLPSLPEDVALLVVGRGPRLSELNRLAVRLGVHRRVRFCADVSDEELPHYLRVADIFVFPSQNRLEGFGLAVVEAMASGLPVVIADLPGVREVIEPGREGLLVEPMIGSDLAARVRSLLDDPGARARMGAAARARAEERYALPAVTRQLIRLYEDLRAAG